MARQTDAVKKLVDQELEKLTPAAGSWHTQYSRSAYVYIGNLDPRLTEGDIITVFSQFGDIVDINLARDKESGKSMGFCFLAYENQKSTILAIDNMVGYSLLGRPVRIDHVLNYKPPKRYSATEIDEEGFPKRIPYEPTGAEGQGVGVFNVTITQRRLSQQGVAMDAMVIKSSDANIDQDELWAKKFEDQLKTELPLVKRERSPTRVTRRDR
jgi:RNA-binding motif X-linked protein 2